MNKKGFTLIEILAVIVLLGIVGVIAYTSINSLVGNTKNNMLKSKINMIETAAIEYGETIKNDIVNSTKKYGENSCEVYKVSELVDKNYIDKENNQNCVSTSFSDEYTIDYTRILYSCCPYNGTNYNSSCRNYIRSGKNCYSYTSLYETPVRRCYYCSSPGYSVNYYYDSDRDICYSKTSKSKTCRSYYNGRCQYYGCPNGYNYVDSSDNCHYTTSPHDDYCPCNYSLYTNASGNKYCLYYKSSYSAYSKTVSNCPAGYVKDGNKCRVYGCVTDPSNSDNYLDNYNIILYYKNNRIHAKMDIDNNLSCS